MNKQKNIRIMVPQPLVCGKPVILGNKQAHYLLNVMRCQKGDEICCFNSESGEFRCLITDVDKSKTVICPTTMIRMTEKTEDIWLLFAPLKKDKTDFVIEKAVELGVARIVPIITSRTNVNQIKIERYMAQAVEAAEQCGRISVPTIDHPSELKSFLAKWDAKRTLYFADERRVGAAAAQKFATAKNRSVAFLIGPEGGFSDEEASFLNNCDFIQNINLGPRILRAETAVTSILAVWQATAGDWQ